MGKIELWKIKKLKKAIHLIKCIAFLSFFIFHNSIFPI